jgi:hypothetical protein
MICTTSAGMTVRAEPPKGIAQAAEMDKRRTQTAHSFINTPGIQQVGCKRALGRNLQCRVSLYANLAHLQENESASANPIGEQPGK